jgi:hypothetical protein
MTKRITAALLALTISALCLAQGHNGQRGARGPKLNMQNLQLISGTVTAVNPGLGMQYPSIAINKSLIKVAPAWYLLDQDFEIRTGDTLDVAAARSNNSADAYLYAAEIANTAAGAKIVLRDAGGVPLWTNRQASGRPAGSGGCLTGAATAVASGTIEQVHAGPGIQMPTLVLKTADGTLLNIRLGPERLLLESDLELKPGDPVTVTYAIASCSGELVALAITDVSGTTVVLRDETGRPLWN